MEPAGPQPKESSQERHSSQVLPDNLLNDHLEDHLYVVGVCGSGEVVIHGLIGPSVTRRKHGSDVVGCSVHIAVRSCVD